MNMKTSVVFRIRCVVGQAQEFDGHITESLDSKKHQAKFQLHPTGVEVLTKKGSHFFVPLSAIKTVWMKDESEEKK